MEYTDQMGRSVVLKNAPQRIVSLVPSQTELLWDLGLGDRIAGITRFCIHPEILFRKAPRIGGTKQLHFDKIRALQPDLIIGNKEENERSQIELLEKEFPVWMSDINTLHEALTMIREVGKLTDTVVKAQQLAEGIAQNFTKLKPGKPLRVVYLIWKKPWMAAGNDTFIHDMLQRCGFVNVVNESRYPVLEEAQLRALQPDLVLLSSEPYPFGEKHKDALRSIFPKATILLVDGEFFSWYGSRLYRAPAYFTQLLQALQA